MTHPAPNACPSCGGEQLHWELRRLRTRNPSLTAKVIHWSCRACGHAWLVPTRPAAEELPLPEP